MAGKLNPNNVSFPRERLFTELFASFHQYQLKDEQRKLIFPMAAEMGVSLEPHRRRAINSSHDEGLGLYYVLGLTTDKTVTDPNITKALGTV
ncbi:hypothetical protein ElyMa_007029500 [Elysia marginata]|uniref:Uncharacterized protein n=1 Tax=Elysia marginata TaxID=1093978 RepID=A0AAV4JS40_9GAST|nr:hypothetical protein ElyMa_007029500 [Elysia marginata]